MKRGPERVEIVRRRAISGGEEVVRIALFGVVVVCDGGGVVGEVRLGIWRNGAELELRSED